MYCTFSCVNNQVNWYAHTCEQNRPCPPYPLTPWQDFFEYNPRAKKMAKMGLILPYKRPISYDYEVQPPPLRYVIPFDKKHFTQEEEELSNALKASYKENDRKILRKKGFDLRGAECEIKDNKEVCFVPHRGGRFVIYFKLNPIIFTICKNQFRNFNKKLPKYFTYF